MSERRLVSIGYVVATMNRHPGVRHFMTGVLIGAALLAALFVLV